jgi:Ni,Fe-hydrogenase I cytochrome b subunit
MLGIGLTAVLSGILVFESGWVFNDELSDVYKTIHHYATWGWLFLVGGHILGVITESILHRDNLILAMVTGCKRVCKIKPKEKMQPLQPKHDIAYKKLHVSEQ